MKKAFNEFIAEHTVSRPPDRRAAHAGPRVALIHGFLGRAYMRDHLLRYLRQTAAPDTTMYGHLHAASAIADELEPAASKAC
jgi:predicted phosphodiesterase